jgi:Zn-dependent membrane protease YugP
MGNLWFYVLVVMLPSIAITGWAALRVRSTYAKWSKVDSGIPMSAHDFARRLLDTRGLSNVRVEPVPGQLTDHYDPRGKVLRVSATVSGSPLALARDPAAPVLAFGDADAGRLSVASAAVIAHEVGHALQDHEGDAWMSVRQTIVPVVQFGSGIAPWLIIGGLLLNMLQLAWIGLFAFAAAVIFTFVTLPVEFGASARALSFVNTLGISGQRYDGAREVLKAAGWTYVAAALTALLTFVYYLTLLMGRRD